MRSPVIMAPWIPGAYLYFKNRDKNKKSSKGQRNSVMWYNKEAINTGDYFMGHNEKKSRLIMELTRRRL